MTEECLFCKIWARELPAKEAYRDDEVLAIEDVRPVAPVHLLIIPKEHISTVKDLKPANAQLLFRMVDRANQLARDRQISRDGYRLVINTGPQAGQSVYHLHLHLIGGRSMGWPPG